MQFAHTICTILHTIWAGILDHVQKKSILQEHVILEGNSISSDLKSEKTQDVRRESYLLASNFTDSRVLLRFAESSICYETGPTSAGPVLQFLIFLYVSHSMLSPLLIVVIFCAPISNSLHCLASSLPDTSS